MKPDSANPSGEEAGLQEEIAKLKADLAQLRSHLKSDARAVARDAGAAATAGAAIAKDRLQDAVDSALVSGREDIDRLEQQIRDHPLASMGIALGVGMVVGALLARS